MTNDDDELKAELIRADQQRKIEVGPRSSVRGPDHGYDTQFKLTLPDQSEAELKDQIDAFIAQRAGEIDAALGRGEDVRIMIEWPPSRQTSTMFAFIYERLGSVAQRLYPPDTMDPCITTGAVPGRLVETYLDIPRKGGSPRSRFETASFCYDYKVGRKQRPSKRRGPIHYLASEWEQLTAERDALRAEIGRALIDRNAAEAARDVMAKRLSDYQAAELSRMGRVEAERDEARAERDRYHAERQELRDIIRPNSRQAGTCVQVVGDCRSLVEQARAVMAERDRARQDADVRLGSIHMACDRLEGLVEGQPPHSGNFLQRIDELVAKEKRLEQLTAERDEARRDYDAVAGYLRDNPNSIAAQCRDARRERDEARAEVERLGKAVRLVLDPNAPTGMPGWMRRTLEKGLTAGVDRGASGGGRAVDPTTNEWPADAIDMGGPPSVRFGEDPASVEYDEPAALDREALGRLCALLPATPTWIDERDDCTLISCGCGFRRLMPHAAGHAAIVAGIEEFQRIHAGCETTKDRPGGGRRQPSAYTLIAAERAKQIAKGWTPEHDDGHVRGELAVAASMVADLSGGWARELCDPEHVEAVRVWPRTADFQFWIRSKSDDERLVVAAAFLVAEIERRQRAAKRPEIEP